MLFSKYLTYIISFNLNYIMGARRVALFEYLKIYADRIAKGVNTLLLRNFAKNIIFIYLFLLCISGSLNGWFFLYKQPY